MPSVKPIHGCALTTAAISSAVGASSAPPITSLATPAMGSAISGSMRSGGLGCIGTIELEAVINAEVLRS
jgi:hypothetical protein